jgi:hypothetical protein
MKLNKVKNIEEKMKYFDSVHSKKERKNKKEEKNIVSTQSSTSQSFNSVIRNI